LPLDITQIVLWILGLVATITLAVWKYRKDEEKARIGRILQPLRDIRIMLQSLVDGYKMDNCILVYYNLNQLGRIIEDPIKKRGLDIDISKESKILLDNLIELYRRYRKAENEFRAKDFQTHDAESRHRLFEAHRTALYKDDQIKNLANRLMDEVEKWSQKHA